MCARVAAKWRSGFTWYSAASCAISRPSARAGQNAIRRFAMAEAVAHLTAALQLLASLADGQEQLRTELELQLLLGGALLATKGWASAEMGNAYRRARELSRQVGDNSQLFPALWGVFMFHHNSAAIRAGYEVAEELLELAHSQEDPAFRVLAHRCAGGQFALPGEV
jgi:predicted ATPase